VGPYVFQKGIGSFQFHQQKQGREQLAPCSFLLLERLVKNNPEEDAECLNEMKEEVGAFVYSTRGVVEAGGGTQTDKIFAALGADFHTSANGLGNVENKANIVHDLRPPDLGKS